MASNYIGIDLGTTESTVSVIEIAKRRDNPLEKLRTLDIYQFNSNFQLEKNKSSLSSALFIDRDNKKVYTGEYAKKLYADGTKPLNTIRSIKTRIGGESEIEVPLNTDKNDLKNYDMTELSAVLLKNIKSSIEKQIDGLITKATITIPAAFDSDERNATLEAAKLAGFKDVLLLDEPTAVLLNLLNRESDIDNISDEFFEDSKKIVVYDIGGGTLDISIAEVNEDEGDFDVKILGRSKRMDFGGDDIDKYIASYFLEEFEKINPSISERTLEEQAIIVSRIVSNAEKHKISFNTKIENVLDNERRRKRVKETVNFEIIDNLKVTDIVITDDLLQQILSPVISMKGGKLIEPLEISLKSCGLKKEDIDLVVLTGGSGKFYLVIETLEKFFNGTQILDFTEYNAVSRGAAIHSYNQEEEDLRKINLDDIMSDNIYIKTNSGFKKIIEHTQEPNSTGTYEYKFEETLDRLEVFLYYGSDNEEEWRYREINGVFYQLDRIYKKGDIVTLDWEFTEDKILKIFFEGKELVNSNKQNNKKYELIDRFEIR